MTLNGMFNALADLLLPRSCAGCGSALPPGRSPVCASCGAALATPPLPVSPSPRPAGLPPVRAVAAYEAVVRAIVVAYKERAHLALSALLAVALARAAASLRPDVLVWVPSSRAAVRARGYDHAHRLATRAGSVLGVRAIPALRVVRPVADQSRLGAAARAANLSGAFAADLRHVAAVRGRRVVLVDDVMTTGASLAEAARALEAVGVTVAGAAVVAAGAYGSPPPRARPPP